ncbi:MAG: hypothetical protein ABJA74_15760 [Lapillicoccus sp.]
MSPARSSTGTTRRTACLSHSALSRLVTRLVDDGRLQRAECVKDRRSLFVELTTAGAQRYARARPNQRRVLREEGPMVSLAR